MSRGGRGKISRAPRAKPSLVLVDTVGRVAKLGEVVAHNLEHSRRTADENEDIGRRLGELLLDHVLGDVTHTILPGVRVGRSTVDLVPELEVVRSLCGALIELLATHDVAHGLVTENEGHLGLVLRIVSNRTDDLKHRGDASTAGDHSDLVHLDGGSGHDAVGVDLSDGELTIALVDETTDGTKEADSLADFEVLEVVTHATRWMAAHGGIDLDDEVDVALGVVVGDRSVAARDGLSLTVLEDEADVLTNGEIEGGILAGEAEAEEHGVHALLGLDNIELFNQRQIQGLVA